MGIGLATTAPEDLERAVLISRQYGLLTNDALIAATMQRLDIQWLATCDDDFDRVPWIKTCKPTAE